MSLGNGGWEVVAVPSLGESVGPFCRAVIVNGIVHVSGTSALSHLSGPILSRYLPATAAEQAELTFDNIEKALAPAGCTLSDVFRMLVIVKDAAFMQAVNVARSRRISGQPRYISTAMIASLLRDDMLVEIEVSALPSV